MDNIIYIKRIEDIKDSKQFVEESYRIAIQNPRILELLKIGMLKCELRSTNDTKYHNIDCFCSIDITKSCCTILEIFDDKLKIKIDDTASGKVLKELCDRNSDNLLASMRAICKPLKQSDGTIVKYIEKLITFDILYCGD